MNRFDFVYTFIAAVAVMMLIIVIGYDSQLRMDKQIALIEQLQGDVKAMTSAFKEMSLELLKSQYAYSSWSIEINKLRENASRVPKIPEIGRWRNRKKTTRGIHDN